MSIQRLSGYLIALYTALTILFLAFVGVLWAARGISWADCAKLGPGTNLVSLVVSIALTWALVGAALFLIRLEKIRTENVMFVVCGLAICMLYFSMLRERVYFGDYLAYIGGAEDILAGRPFSSPYVYPPFWASFLADVIRLFGKEAAVYVCFAINQLSFAAFFLLASLFLTRCGISLNLAGVLVFSALLVNVPALRNLVYVQVNLLLMDFVLGSVLLFSKARWASAVLLAAAAHLKIVPLLFVPVFLQTRRWMWLFFFALAGAGLALLTILTDGIGYYFDFVRNVAGWSPPSLRSSSIRGFLHSTHVGTGWNIPVGALTLLTTAVLFAVICWISYLSIRNRTFARSGDAATDGIINGVCPLLFVMPAIAPAVWVHHLVVLIVPAVLVLLRLQSVPAAGCFAVGYFFTFLMPTFDCYPWSYLRLVGWMMLLALTAHVIRTRTEPSWPSRVDDSLNSAVKSIARAVRSDPGEP